MVKFVHYKKPKILKFPGEISRSIVDIIYSVNVGFMYHFHNNCLHIVIISYMYLIHPHLLLRGHEVEDCEDLHFEMMNNIIKRSLHSAVRFYNGEL